MNRMEHLLTILCEEAAEVQQATTKLMRFGADEGRDIGDNHADNTVRLRYEINQLYAMVEMLRSEGLNLDADLCVVQEKKAKVEKYLEYRNYPFSLCTTKPFWGILRGCSSSEKSPQLQAQR